MTDHLEQPQDTVEVPVVPDIHIRTRTGVPDAEGSDLDLANDQDDAELPVLPTIDILSDPDCPEPTSFDEADGLVAGTPDSASADTLEFDLSGDRDDAEAPVPLDIIIIPDSDCVPDDEPMPNPSADDVTAGQIEVATLSDDLC